MAVCLPRSRHSGTGHAETLAEAAGSAGVLTDRWIVADAGHVDAVLVHPDEYERRLGEFFGRALRIAL